MSATQEHRPALTASRARISLGRYQGAYNEMPAYGEGRVTRRVLEEVTPRVGERLNTPELRRLWRERSVAEWKAAKALGLGPPRADVQKMRGILSKGGPEALREHVRRYGYAGLPAVAPLVAVPGQERPDGR